MEITIKRKKQKAQQEMVGFAVIIILVMVIGVFFLGVFLRKSKNVDVTDAEISNFLSASLGYTVECSKEYEPDTLKEVIEMCNSQAICINDISSCDLVNSSYSPMIQKFMPAGTLNYYQLVLSSQISLNDSSTKREIMRFSAGNSSNCPSSSGGRNTFSSSSGGYIVSELRICANEEA